MTKIIIEYRFQQLLSIVTPNTRSPDINLSICYTSQQTVLNIISRPMG